VPLIYLTANSRQSGDCEQGAELILPTVGQAADDDTANRSNNKNRSVGFRDNCIWQTKKQTESDSDKPARPRRQLDERDY